jgi:hypothetical protein
MLMRQQHESPERRRYMAPRRTRVESTNCRMNEAGIGDDDAVGEWPLEIGACRSRAGAAVAAAAATSAPINTTIHVPWRSKMKNPERHQPDDQAERGQMQPRTPAHPGGESAAAAQGTRKAEVRGVLSQASLPPRPDDQQHEGRRQRPR